jgi:hypothetical protein
MGGGKIVFVVRIQFFFWKQKLGHLITFSVMWGGHIETVKQLKEQQGN